MSFYLTSRTGIGFAGFALFLGLLLTGCHTPKNPEPSRQELGMQQVVRMSQQHIDDGIIIREVRTSGVIYHLSGDDIIYLKQNGVSDFVIQAMQASAGHYHPYPPPPPAVVVEPAPVSIGIGARIR